MLLSALQLLCIAAAFLLACCATQLQHLVVWYSHPFLDTLGIADHLHTAHIMSAACTGPPDVRGMWSSFV
jgi:hypothetical protein